MDIAAAAILGVVQGLTEFLPISSSAHLILVPWIFGWEPNGLIFDVALHIGTAVAILVYFWRDWITLGIETIRGIITRAPFGNRQRLLAWYLVVGTIPAMVIGLAFEDAVERELRSPLITVATLTLFGALLYYAERSSTQKRRLADFTLLDSILIGVAQAVALIPGVSRSGITITAAMSRDVDRPSAARFSFLLATPVVVGAGLLEGWHLFKALRVPSPAGAVVPLVFPAHKWIVLAVGVVSAGVTGFLCIRYFLRYLQTNSFVPFVIYRFILAAVVLVFYFRFR
jgi:undecaprenyl-diphosphatase